GDGGAWVTGPAAKGITCDAAMFPVVVGDPDLDATEDLLRIAVELDGYLHRHDEETSTPDADRTADAGGADGTPDADSKADADGAHGTPGADSAASADGAAAAGGAPETG